MKHNYQTFVEDLSDKVKTAETAETGNRTPNSGVKGSGANHYPRAPALLTCKSSTYFLFADVTALFLFVRAISIDSICKLVK